MRTAGHLLSVCAPGLLLGHLACSHQGEAENAHMGNSRELPQSSEEQSSEGSVAGRAEDGQATSESEEEQELVSLDELAEQERQQRQIERAQEALDLIAAPDNDLGLVFSLSQRAADLMWLLAVENRGKSDVRLATLPSLISFEVTPPPPDDADPQSKKSDAKVTCGGPQSSLSSGDTVVMQPGQLLTYEFDPREFCEDDSVLVEGATVTATYGFPIVTKKVWKKGGLVTVPIEQKAPYVAEELLPESAMQAGEDLAPSAGIKSADETPSRQTELRQLLAPPFFLDETYPLEAVSALPPDPRSQEGAGGQDESSGSEPPREPLSLTIQPMGSTSNPDVRLVTVRVRNTSGKPLRLFWRREHLTFQVVSELTTATCHLQPSDRAPDASAFSYLSPGSSRTYSTRLREACPKGTFDEEGTYFVSARLDANSTGEEFGYQAFVGTVMTKTPAKFTVEGSSATRRMWRVPLRASTSAKSPPPNTDPEESEDPVDAPDPEDSKEPVDAPDPVDSEEPADSAD